MNCVLTCRPYVCTVEGEGLPDLQRHEGLFRGPQSLRHGHPHGVELVVTSHFLAQTPAVIVLEHDDVGVRQSVPLRRHGPDDP